MPITSIRRVRNASVSARYYLFLTGILRKSCKSRGRQAIGMNISMRLPSRRWKTPLGDIKVGVSMDEGALIQPYAQTFFVEYFDSVIP